MKCQKCGNDIEQGSKFCGNCGQTLVASTTQAQPAAAPPTNQQQQQQQQQQPAQPMVAQQPQQPQQPNNFASGYNQAASIPMQPTQNVPVAANNAAPAYPVAVSNRSGFAVTSLVLSILAFPAIFIPFGPIVLGVAAIIFGSISLKSSRKGLAVAGLVIGIVASIFYLIIFIFILSAAKNAAENNYRSQLYQPTSSEISEPAISVQTILDAASFKLLP